MRITLRQLHIFTAIAEHGSTTAAASSIPLSQSATSAALGELEAMLGASLFDRVGKRLQLNETGRALLDPARSLLDMARTIETHFGMDGGNPGAPLPARIRLGASTTIGNYLMPARIARLLEAHALASVEMRIGNTQEIVGAVLRREVDAGVIEGPCHADELEALPWLSDELVFVVAAHHPLAQSQTPCPLAELRKQRWLLRESGSGTREAVDNVLLPHLGNFDLALQLGSTEAIKQAAAAGLGIACLSRSAVQDLVDLGRLALLRTTLPPLHRQLYRIRHRSKQFSPALALLLEQD
ncbi:MAG: HTH-type transcriptional activator CmpR [Kerstersia gyiorum]|uniref:LysR family transcriptional regulator n=1 Tax=Kerstersia gyiorum TaxID=206506 RepID=UPI0030D55BF8